MTGAMRIALLTLALALATGCGNKSKLDTTRGGDVDALWDLAPDGTELAIVASPRAVDLTFRAIDALRELVKHPDFVPARPQLYALTKAMFGSDTATPADAGFSTDKGFAMFATGDGVLGIMPVGDRDKFMASKQGQRGSAEDTLDGNTCREIGKHYVCATKVEMFDRLGKGSLRGKLAVAGARGDAEVYMTNLPLLGDTTGELAVAAQLEPGQVSLHGAWLGTPSGALADVVGIAAPQPETSGASGYVAINMKPLLADAPPVPFAGDVTLEQLAKSLAGPITAKIPAGTVDIQMFAPLTDPEPAQAALDHCQDIGRFFELAPTQTPGACRFMLRGTSQLELDAWVENNTLRLGAKKGPPPPGKPGAMTAVGRELASGNWTAAFWGRGTMLNLSGITPAAEEATPGVALGIHAIALVNELGAAARVDTDGLRFRAFLRTAWANPPALVPRILEVSGNDILTGKAMMPAMALAAIAPGTPFAADFDAGQGGLMVPAAVIGIVSAVVIPAVMQMFAGGDASADAPPGEAMNSADLVTLLLHAYIEEAYPKWQADHPGKKCPATLAEVAKYFDAPAELPVTTDPWGHALVMTCDDKGFSVMSVGPDGQPGTADDVRP